MKTRNIFGNHDVTVIEPEDIIMKDEVEIQRRMKHATVGSFLVTIGGIILGLAAWCGLSRLFDSFFH